MASLIQEWFDLDRTPEFDAPQLARLWRLYDLARAAGTTPVDVLLSEDVKDAEASCWRCETRFEPSCLVYEVSPGTSYRICESCINPHTHDISSKSIRSATERAIVQMYGVGTTPQRGH